MANKIYKVSCFCSSSFLMKGNYTDKNNNFYSTDVLYEAWKNYIGNEIDWYGETKIISEVCKYNDDEIIITTTSKDINL